MTSIDTAVEFIERLEAMRSPEQVEKYRRDHYLGMKKRVMSA